MYPIYTPTAVNSQYMLSSQTGRSANTYILLHNEIEENYVFGT